MLCEKCQTQDATVHIQAIVGKKRRTLHLCAACAAGQGLTPDPAASLAVAGLDLPKLLAQLAKALPPVAAAEPAAEPEAPAAAGATCPECGLAEADLRKAGRLGCPNCYRVFANILSDLLPAMHRGVAHLGKRPGAAAAGGKLLALRLELAGLERELADAVATEQYEAAASLRDRIAEVRQTAAAEMAP
ncbi:MAG: UvrB/UvrC motif-containing protein [Lentisphaeria bacterium]|jgi:protein arginine kinase activator